MGCVFVEVLVGGFRHALSVLQSFNLVVCGDECLSGSGSSILSLPG